MEKTKTLLLATNGGGISKSAHVNVRALKEKSGAAKAAPDFKS
jgi:hypothetical protein